MCTRSLLPRPTLTPADRVRQAIANKQFAEAVRMALDITNEPALLFEAVKGRVHFWRQSGQTNFAIDLIRKVLPRLSGNPAWVQTLANELAACGAAADAMALVPDAGPMRIIAADAAMERGTTGRASLPEDLRAGCDAAVEAMAAFKAGNDDEARAKLQLIGLASPFLEWKLMLRGLMAWHAGEDAKAIENWSRLDAKRLPCRLIAPLRSRIDSDFARKQPPDDQFRLRRQADRLYGVPFVAELRGFQKDMTNGEPHTVIRRVIASLPHLQAQAPEAMPRVVEALGAMLLHRGDVEDVDRVAEHFPPLPKDPTFDQMRGVITECAGKFIDSRQYWLKYEKVLADNPALFGEDTALARAIIWWHVGQLGQMNQARDAMPFGPPKVKKPLSPSEAECRARALELAPSFREPLFAELIDAEAGGAFVDIIAAGERLLAQHPNDEETLDILIEACDEKLQPDQHLKYVRRLFDLHPLDEVTRSMTARAYRMTARCRADENDLTTARADAEQASALDEVKTIALLTALDLRAGNVEAAEPRIAAFIGIGDAGFAVRLLAEVNELGVAKGVTSRLTPVITTALSAELPLLAFTSLAIAFADLESECITYRGAKTHGTKFAKKLTATLRRSTASADELGEVCTLAIAAGWYEAALAGATNGRRRFHGDARFPYLSASAMLERGRMNDEYHARRDLGLAKNFLEETPPAARPPWLADAIDDLREEYDLDESPFGGGRIIDVLADMFGGGR